LTKTFSTVIEEATLLLKGAPLVKSGYWQGVDTSGHPEMATNELLNYTLRVDKTHTTREQLVKEIQPDLPWADDHFAERISRMPLNPPASEAWWPHAPKGNDRFKNEIGFFSHTYPERYWPKTAGGHDGIIPLCGIRFPYGDLDDLVSLLSSDPMTRQAYLPVWFPEDLGAPITERKPCTLGYHFIVRNDQLHVVYFIRSCDFVRHFRNDIYLTVLLQHWVLKELAGRNAKLGAITSGSFTMHITSLHIFRNDYYKLFSGGVH
jgi:hypothetical protein